jgi:(1->4)-alpha-D-glucan 1-alpha-D-glucosylmutase
MTQASKTPSRAPLSTYRLQFNRTFTFRDAAELIPYLHRLGIDWVYASPYLQARPGSMHGYDISNHNRVNPEIGTPEEHGAMVDAMRQFGMGHLLDIVPNHMGIGQPDNQWWMDVLENGPSSLYAPFFDIDWQPLKPELAGRVLLPLLGDQFGRVLERGELQLSYENGVFLIHYYDQIFPVSPRSRSQVLLAVLQRLHGRLAHDDPDRLELESIANALEHLPLRDRTDRESVEERNRENVVTRRRVAALCNSSAVFREAMEETIREFNGQPGDPHSFDALERLLDDQAYRLAFWRVAAEEINFRRFFDVNDLAGIRVELREVFQSTHRLILQLVAEGKVEGLRIDHPDGLYDPESYLAELQAECIRRTGGDATYVVVEKILTGAEELPQAWEVAGTVGYEFLHRLNGLFVDPAREPEMTATYIAFVGRELHFRELAYHRKRLILRVALISELNVLAHLLDRISETNRRYRDFSLGSLREALREVLACFPVYRTYIDAHTGQISESDAAYVNQAVRVAIRRNPATNRTVFDFIRDTLLLRWPEDLTDEWREEHARFVMKFQQLTGPVMAKGVEDTTFYLYNRLVSLNEVGGEPERFGLLPAELHAWLAKRYEQWPLALNATSTHDTKRSEDVRARIDVLSEFPAEWRARVNRWAELNTPLRGTTEDESIPAPNDEYLLYQTLVGAWPLGEPDEAGRQEFVERMQRYMEKATREAKVRTSWINPSEEYDTGLRDFVAAALANEAFLADFRPFQRLVARIGMLNSLSQTLVKLTCPGVPDVYQGQEIWDFSLVDPDNRRPVDYGARSDLLDSLLSGARDSAALFERWEDGGPKLWVTHTALALRRRVPDLFRAGEYVPLEASGERSEHLFAFARRHGDERAITIAPRLWGALAGGEPGPVPRAKAWGDTALEIPAGLEGRYRSLLSGEEVACEEGRLAVGELLARWPVALLVPA